MTCSYVDESQIELARIAVREKSFGDLSELSVHIGGTCIEESMDSP